MENNLKTKSHQEYNSLTKEEQDKMKQWASSKLPRCIKFNESAIMTKVYSYIRTKI